MEGAGVVVGGVEVRVRVEVGHEGGVVEGGGGEGAHGHGGGSGGIIEVREAEVEGGGDGGHRGDGDVRWWGYVTRTRARAKNGGVVECEGVGGEEVTRLRGALRGTCCLVG